MNIIRKNDYSALDAPEILSVLFYPRKDDRFGRKRAGSDMMIPVDNQTVVGARFYHASKRKPTILFFHGNGEIASDYDDIGPLYGKLGINFIVADYRGYGLSTGRPTVTDMMADCHVIFDYCVKRLDAEGYTGPLVVMGRSLGSASALEAAYYHADALAGLIIESGFAYMLPLLRLIGVPFAALHISEEDGCRNIEKIKRFEKATLIIHSQFDQIIPFSDGQALYDASGASAKRLLMIPGADHNSIFAYGLKKYLAAVADFTESLTSS